MKKAGGVIELLISFLLISIIVAMFLQMTIIQNPEGKLEPTTINKAQQDADKMIDKIEKIKEQKLQHEEKLIKMLNE